MEQEKGFALLGSGSSHGGNVNLRNLRLCYITLLIHLKLRFQYISNALNLIPSYSSQLQISQKRLFERFGAHLPKSSSIQYEVFLVFVHICSNIAGSWST